MMKPATEEDAGPAPIPSWALLTALTLVIVQSWLCPMIPTGGSTGEGTPLEDVRGSNSTSSSTKLTTIPDDDDSSPLQVQMLLLVAVMIVVLMSFSVIAVLVNFLWKNFMGGAADGRITGSSPSTNQKKELDSAAAHDSRPLMETRASGPGGGREGSCGISEKLHAPKTPSQHAPETPSTVADLSLVRATQRWADMSDDDDDSDDADGEDDQLASSPLRPKEEEKRELEPTKKIWPIISEKEKKHGITSGKSHHHHHHHLPFLHLRKTTQPTGESTKPRIEEHISPQELSALWFSEESKYVAKDVAATPGKGKLSGAQRRKMKGYSARPKVTQTPHHPDPSSRAPILPRPEA